MCRYGVELKHINILHMYGRVGDGTGRTYVSSKLSKLRIIITTNMNHRYKLLFHPTAIITNCF